VDSFSSTGVACRLSSTLRDAAATLTTDDAKLAELDDASPADASAAVAVTATDE
jgi:hypothetical protein